MGLYTYLDLTDAEEIPGNSEGYTAYFAETRDEFEAKNYLPTFWGRMFRPEELKHQERYELDIDDSREPAGHEPFLVATRTTALERLRETRELARSALGPEFAGLYDEWAAFIGDIDSTNVILRGDLLLEVDPLLLLDYTSTPETFTTEVQNAVAEEHTAALLSGYRMRSYKREWPPPEYLP